MKSWIQFALIVLTLTLLGCITVNVYFPAPEVRQAAEEIVEETWGGPPDAAPPTAPGPSSSLLDLLVAPAWAAEVDINVSTAAIRTLKDQMKARAEQLKPHLAAGRVGIAQDGMLVVRNTDGLTLKDQATLRRLVEAENGDRQALYREIARANKFGDDQIPQIQRIFAETWIQKADPGWWVQQGGQWRKK